MCGRFKASSYKYKFVRNGITLANRKVIGNDFDEDFITTLKLSKHNDLIVFYDVEVMMPGELVPRTLDLFTLMIEDHVDENTSENSFNINFITGYWKDTSELNLTKYYMNGNKMLEIKKTQNKFVRKLYQENGDLIQKANIKFVFKSDTSETFNPETYEQVLKVDSGFVEIFNGNFIQYHENGKHIELQGLVINNKKQGLWTYCKHPEVGGVQECYEANFKADVLVGKLKKVGKK
jgi:hypothetical protein